MIDNSLYSLDYYLTICVVMKNFEDCLYKPCLVAQNKNKKQKSDDEDEEEEYIPGKMQKLRSLEKEHQEELKKSNEEKNRKIVNIWGQGACLYY